MKNLFKDCKNLPVEVWLFVTMTLINRMGAMVVPFMSKYLYEDLKYSYTQIGTVMFFFGAGSIIGTFLVGKITKKISPYKLMLFSMFFNGAIIFMLQFVTEFYTLCFTVFMLNVVADMFRPSMIATLKDYVKKEDRVSAFSLIRTASNFGFVVSPVIAGIAIATVGYNLLFWIDGMTSILAISLFAFFVKEKKLLHKLNLHTIKTEKLVFFKDRLLLLHCLITVLTGIVFFQIFTVLPLYYTDILKLANTFNTYALVFYGTVLFIFEMAVVNYVKRKVIRTLNAIMFGLMCMAIGYAVLMAFNSIYAVFVSLMIICFGVMLTFPFATDFVLERSYKNLEAKFLSYFQMSYGLAHLISAKLSMYVVHHFGYTTNFALNVGFAVIGAGLSYLLIMLVVKERKDKKADIIKSFFA
ncbi:MFS transporter [Flavobacterium sp.]|uniref:MFS transporter n=1 Tax=Flavobacterium sp. TaxID=239 RepID=UPI003D0D0E47